MKHVFLSGAVALASLSALSACSDAAEADAVRVEISEAHIKPPLAGRDVAAGYFQATALGGDSAIVSASTPLARTTELHTHTMEDGKMMMRQVERVELPEGEPVVFEPASYHLMMFGFDAKDARETNLTLTYEDGQSVTLVVPIGKL